MSGHFAARALILPLAALALSGCLTPHAKVAPSSAVLAARAGVGAKPGSCQVGKLQDVSPTVATFPFDDAVLDEAGARSLARAAAWLTCTPGVPAVVIATADNHGDEAHRKDLAARRAQATLAALRGAGAKDAVIHLVAPGGADPVTGPHLIIQADGRGW
jgi:outer membrane protein OmpA-like peptidoglycan-associated protein